MSSRRTTLPTRPLPRISAGTAFLYGCTAGVIGVFAMTASEKTEQSLITNRANSYVPGWTLVRLLGIDPSPDSMWNWNMAMHYGQGAIAGGIRGVMALYGVRGPFADFMFTGLRLAIDQTLENWTGVGALPWTWPVAEQIVDVLHKSVFAFVTGYIADMWIQ